MEKKYELTENTKKYDRHILHRIKALRDIPYHHIKKGDLGGWIESEANLSKEENCWVYENAWVFDHAWISGNAKVSGDAKVSGNAQIFDHAWISGNALVSGDAKVYENAWVFDHAKVSGNAQVSGNAYVSGNAQIFGNAQISSNSIIYENAQVSGNAQIRGDVSISGNALIESRDDYIAIDNIGSRLDITTAFRTQEHSIKIKCGCFCGTIDGFKDAVMETHKNNDKYRNEYLSFIEIIKAHFNIV